MERGGGGEGRKERERALLQLYYIIPDLEPKTLFSIYTSRYFKQIGDHAPLTQRGCLDLILSHLVLLYLFFAMNILLAISQMSNKELPRYPEHHPRYRKNDSLFSKSLPLLWSHDGALQTLKLETQGKLSLCSGKFMQELKLQLNKTTP